MMENEEKEKHIERIYHVVSYDNYCKYFANIEFIDTSVIQRDFKNEKRRKIEESLEKIRRQKFPELPSRITSLFVFNEFNKENSEKDWASIYSNPQYILLTLEVISGTIKWFDNSTYEDFYQKDESEEMVELYWNSLSDLSSNNTSIEGLFQGIAKIIKRESKMYSKMKGITFIEDFEIDQ